VSCAHRLCDNAGLWLPVSVLGSPATKQTWQPCQRICWLPLSPGVLKIVCSRRLASTLESEELADMEEGEGGEEAESLALWARAAASLQPDGTRLPARRCQVRELA
jgi:hypothetical protein